MYQQYADNPDEYDISAVNAVDLMTINIGVDFGGTGSAHAFVATGFLRRFEKVIPLQSKRITEAIDPEQLNQRFADFVKIVYNQYKKPMSVYADSAEQVLIRGLRRIATQEHLPIIIHNARKLPINDRIRLVNKLIAQGRFGVCRGAQSVKSALCEALWNPKKDDERLDDGTTDIDTLDAMEYSIEPFFGELSRI